MKKGDKVIYFRDGKHIEVEYVRSLGNGSSIINVPHIDFQITYQRMWENGEAEVPDRYLRPFALGVSAATVLPCSPDHYETVSEMVERLEKERK